MFSIRSPSWPNTFANSTPKQSLSSKPVTPVSKIPSALPSDMFTNSFNTMDDDDYDFDFTSSSKDLMLLSRNKLSYALIKFLAEVYKLSKVSDQGLSKIKFLIEV